MESVYEEESGHPNETGKFFMPFVRRALALVLVGLVTYLAVEEYRVSTSSITSAVDYKGLELTERIQARLCNAESCENRRAGLLKQSVDRKGLSRKLTGLSKTPKSGFKVKMLHRNSAESPFRKTYETKLQALAEDMVIDATRLAAFRNQKNRNNSSGSGVENHTANPPVITAVIAGPPSHDYGFQSPVVSGSTLGSGQYFVDFFLGTPPQKFSLIVDSGSDLLWVQCSPCRQCYAQDSPLYVPSNSSTFSPVPCLSSDCLLIPATEGFPCDFRYPGACAYEYLYADTSSSKGVFAYESATVDGVRIDKVAFGCGSDNQGSFAAAGGVLGLGQGPLSFGSQVGYAYGNKFAYCLVNYLDPTSVSSSLIFGDELISTIHDMQYTPIVSNPKSPTLYYVQIEKVTVGGKSLPISDSAWEIDLLGNGGSIFDSGTTLTYWFPSAYSHILAAFDSGVHYPRAESVQGLDLCVELTGVDQPSFPSFTIEFDDGAVFQPEAENYFVDVAPNVRCLAMAGLASPLGGFNTIGNLLQQNFFVQYDREENLIGFAPAKCSSHS
ncbi:aspartyl protease family protein 2 [Physcomitrium patens]|uniref:Peptidase A1 domain-containing protein n=2 Tax=Physcomitrium patens TaxID=3218 RepID=A0A2K1KCT9_PHYPA|nr:aspartyl protease family protein 2-like [Physcomitrium patens]XP_024381709.1 aspartyl protease family protein 2-like [Physcomitrium patens]PNR51559.1 hypothetical protein PHYPA_010746 [Physcomitrium patens]|eukprot:XP_024381708.1 aspartyl protease family protein 2-like [Physcomitrella patens]